jgi:hypothetical protein
MAPNIKPDRAAVVTMRPGMVCRQRADLGRQFEAASGDDRQVVIAEGCVYVLDQHVDLALNAPTGGSLQPMGGDTRAA